MVNHPNRRRRARFMGPAEWSAMSGAGIPFPEFCINPDAITWREIGEGSLPRSHLLTTINFGGALLNLHAFEVRFQAEDAMWLVCQDYDESALWEAFGMEGHAETVDIDGRYYVLFANPYCD